MPLVHGEPSIHLATPELDLDLTLRGGHLAPLVFHLPGREVSPYSLSPWEPSEFPDLPPLLSVLRGDFFCLPFGGQDHGPPHGDPANAHWTVTEETDRALTVALDASDSDGHFEKTFSVRPGQHALYAEHRISKLEGAFSYGTHPILDLSHLPAGTGRVTTSPFRWASVFPGPFANPAEGETQALAEGQKFTDLRAVPLAAGGTTDLTRYPAREGNEDLVMMVNEPVSDEQPFAWSAVVLDGYLWFTLKNSADFPATLFWLSNRGRTAAPWNDRHRGRIGIEEVCSYFSEGVAVSRQDLLADEGVPTTRTFSRGETVTLRLIHAAAPVPEGFAAVAKIVPASDETVLITDENGLTVTTRVDWAILSDPNP